MTEITTPKPKRLVFSDESILLDESFLLQVLRKMILERVARAPWNKQTTIRVRDLEAYGLSSVGAKTEFGWLLNQLARAGLVWISKRARPRKYVVKHELIKLALSSPDFLKEVKEVIDRGRGGYSTS